MGRHAASKVSRQTADDDGHILKVFATGEGMAEPPRKTGRSER